MSQGPARALARTLDALSPRPEGLLVALSGGLDSSALLTLARAWAREHDRDGQEIPLTALHVDHAMRASSAEDARWCASLCEDLGVHLDVVTLATAPTSQSSARAMRTAHLALAALEHGADTILSAHHEDDVLETALMNLTRGASSTGVTSLARAVAPMAGVPGALGLRWCRPLIGCTRESLERFWGDRAHAVDPTNETDGYRRNRVRHHVLPALLDEPGARAGARVTIENLAGEASALEARALDLSNASWSRATPLRVEVDLRALDAASRHDAELAAFWRHLARALPGSGSWTRAHLTALTEMARGVGEDEVGLPGAHASRRGAHVSVEVGTGRGAPRRVAHAIALDLSAPGQTRWFGGSLSWGPAEATGGLTSALEARVVARAGSEFSLRGIERGARLDTGARVLELRELARAAGVHPRDRWRIPCLCEGEAPVWLMGVRRGARAEAEAGREGAVALRWSPAASDRK